MKFADQTFSACRDSDRYCTARRRCMMMNTASGERELSLYKQPGDCLDTDIEVY